MTYVCQLFPSQLFDLILQICLLDLLWICPLISLDVYCGLLLVGNAIKCYLNLLAVCLVWALLSSYLFFRFRSAMPPRHSKRTHATSSEAIRDLSEISRGGGGVGILNLGLEIR